MAGPHGNSAPRIQRRNAFFWQGILIVLPVFVLAAAGLFSLRQDKILAQHEAAERAQAIADDMVRRIWTELTEARNPSLVAFRIDHARELIFPTPFSAVPRPRLLDPAELSAKQRQLWESAQQMEHQQAFASAIEAYREFTTQSPPENFAGAACFRLGLLLSEQTNRAGAMEMFQAVSEKYPSSVGESGLPLAPLAQLKIAQQACSETNHNLGQVGSMLATLCSNAVFNPSSVSPLILEKATELARSASLGDVVLPWQSEWERQQLARRLYTSSSLPSKAGVRSPAELSTAMASSQGQEKFGEPAGKPLRLFWIKLTDDWKASNQDAIGVPSATGLSTRGGRDWLAVRFDDPTNGCLICCRTAPRVLGLDDTEFWFHLSGNRPTPLPEHFGISVYLAGAAIFSSSSSENPNPIGESRPFLIRPAHPPAPILATATKIEDGTEYLRCNIHLIKPQMLFARQRERTVLFGLLIAVSAGAALVGFLAARRAFYRQLRLAEMKTNFVSSVSHELRAPIASVRLMAEGLEPGRIQDAGKQHEYFRFIVQECRRLSSMIENVLDFSRIEQGRKQYEFEPTDLLALVEQTIRLMETQAAERQIPLETVVTGQPTSIEADGRAIQQAMVNLIDNALKHSPNGSLVRTGVDFPLLEPVACLVPEVSKPAVAQCFQPAVSGATRALTDPNEPLPAKRPTFQHSSPPPVVRLWVEDNGDGIAPEEHERSFERFYRCGSELRRETQGVGIGLSIVKHIVEAHRGRILVRSAPGQGSRFTIEFPIRIHVPNPGH